MCGESRSFVQPTTRAQKILRIFSTRNVCRRRNKLRVFSLFCFALLLHKDNGGYLMKRRSMTHPWTCVHGGTSATLVALLEGRTLITANVGDSSALLAMQGRRLEVRIDSTNCISGVRPCVCACTCVLDGCVFCFVCRLARAT